MHIKIYGIHLAKIYGMHLKTKVVLPLTKTKKRADNILKFKTLKSENLLPI